MNLLKLNIKENISDLALGKDILILKQRKSIAEETNKFVFTNI